MEADSLWTSSCKYLRERNSPRFFVTSHQFVTMLKMNTFFTQLENLHPMSIRTPPTEAKAYHYCMENTREITIGFQAFEWNIIKPKKSISIHERVFSRCFWNKKGTECSGRTQKRQHNRISSMNRTCSQSFKHALQIRDRMELQSFQFLLLCCVAVLIGPQFVLDLGQSLLLLPHYRPTGIFQMSSK